MTTHVGIDPRTQQPFIDEYTGQPIECMNDQDGECRGEITYRASLTGTGTAMVRCDYHQDKRLDLQDKINDRYGTDSDLAPAWFKPSWGGANEYGERWDSD